MFENSIFKSRAKARDFCRTGIPEVEDRQLSRTASLHNDEFICVGYSSDRSPTGDDDARIIRIAAAAAAAVNDGSEGAVRPPVILRHGAE